MQPNMIPVAVEIPAAVNSQLSKPIGKTGTSTADKSGNPFGNVLQAAVSEDGVPELKDAKQQIVPDNQVLATNFFGVWGQLPVNLVGVITDTAAQDVVLGVNPGAATLLNGMGTPIGQLSQTDMASPLATVPSEQQIDLNQFSAALENETKPQTASVGQSQVLLTPEQLGALLKETNAKPTDTAGNAPVMTESPTDHQTTTPVLTGQASVVTEVQSQGLVLPVTTQGKVNNEPVVQAVNNAEAFAAANVQQVNAVNAKEDASGPGLGMFAENKESGQGEIVAPKADSIPATNFALAVDQHSVRTADAAEIRVETPQTARPDPHNVTGQIVEHARLFARVNNSEMIIKLKPEHLGELTMKVIVENGTVSATFHSTNSEVRSIVEASLPQLRQDMSNQGLKVDHVGVYTSLDQFFTNDQQQNADQQAMFKNAAKNRGSNREFEDAVETVTAPVMQTAESGIDYRV